MCTTMTAAEMREATAKLAQLFSERLAHLSTELAKYKGHVEHVERENKQFRELIVDIQNKFSILGGIFDSDSASSASGTRVTRSFSTRLVKTCKTSELTPIAQCHQTQKASASV